MSKQSKGKSAFAQLYANAIKALSKGKKKNMLLVESGIAIFLMAVLLFPMLATRSKMGQSTATKVPGNSTTNISIVLPPEDDIKVSVFIADKNVAEEMDFEEYLVGVVSAEMPASYEGQALKAQAVAARTYAYQKMQAGGCKSGYDVCSDYGCCQAYNDEQQRKDKWEGDFQKYEDIIREAVFSTAGEVMVYGGEPIQAFFHSTSGGMTEDVQNVFGDDLPYLVGVPSEGEEEAPRFRQTKTMTAGEFIAGIRKLAPDASINADDIMASIGEIKRYESGRINTIVIGGVEIGGREIRTAFTLDSTNFTIEVSGGQVSITTTGYGHGVGMSQAGANAMAKTGSEYKDILLHYYTGIEFTKISSL